ncbi:Sodium/glucose cotransporter 4 [Desmophyllum pertusum]|uniref:Sodium/glucose cotransporter 4 n=1 Tax=Desmophyllum pertusum TaxID=174260 RepID=A0A9W9ZAY4_9CNID|nr:Sodium/glucose cotransporter 4 [Desmophyllum pertusum]
MAIDSVGRYLVDGADICLFFPKTARDRERIVVGRVVVAVLVGISLLWLPVVKGFAGNQLFVYLPSISFHVSPGNPVDWNSTEHGAVAGLLVGFAMGIIKFIVENAYAPPDCGEEDTRPDLRSCILCIYSNILFAISVFTMGGG